MVKTTARKRRQPGQVAVAHVRAPPTDKPRQFSNHRHSRWYEEGPYKGPYYCHNLTPSGSHNTALTSELFCQGTGGSVRRRRYIPKPGVAPRRSREAHPGLRSAHHAFTPKALHNRTNVISFWARRRQSNVVFATCKTPSAYAAIGAHDHPGCAANDGYVVARRPRALECNRFAVMKPRKR